VYREAVALARVHHPGLAAVLEVGEVDGLPYLVMELVEGETLADRLFRGALGEADTLDLGVQLLSALREVHAVGLVHRDVKPANIVLTRNGRARLIDFGFTIPFELASRDGELAGSRGYTAPEQFVPMARVDGRADLYAVGRVLQDCLVGRAPQLVSGSTRSLDAANASPRFAPLLVGLSAADPEARYRDARTVLRDLDALKRDAPALGAAASVPERRIPVLVGRAAELERLNRSWRSTGTAGGSVTLVVGERGGGKSRLLDACAATASDAGGRRVLEVSCREGDPPLAAIRRIVDGYVKSFGRMTESTRQAAREAFAGATAPLEDRLVPFGRLIASDHADLFGFRIPSRPADTAPGGFPDGAAEILVRLARSGPLVILIDDMQWIDPVSRETVLCLAERTHGAAVSLVLATRSGAVASDTVEQLLALDRVRLGVVDLSLFGPKEVAALVAQYLGESEARADVAHRIASLADGTPLGVLEVLRTFLDCGALRPHGGRWALDAARAESVVLPKGALAMLGGRLEEVPRATRRVLEAAALLGTAFDETLLARVIGLTVADLGYALADARQAGLIVSEHGAQHRFVHDSLREKLVDSLDARDGRRLHQRIAELMDDGATSDFEVCCAAAQHYAAGEIEKTAGAAHRVARVAATAALDRFDNETALRFLDLARGVAHTAGLRLDESFHRSVGEAELRLGRLEDSLRSFEAALVEARDAQARAEILGRIAWVYQACADPTRAWAALEQAFFAIGALMPVETAASARDTIGQAVRGALRRRSREASLDDPRASARIGLLCELHYQNARLGGEYGKPIRFVESTVDAVVMSESLGEGRVRARARASYGVVLTALGLSAAGIREIDAARQMAGDQHDPTTQAFAVQMRAMAASITGKLDTALELLRECVDVHGAWLELNEYCLNAATGDHIESVRGRPVEAMAWNARVLRRQRQSHRMAAVSAQYLVYRTTAALASLGRDRAAEQPASRTPRALPTSSLQSLYHIISWGPRARVFLETGQLGAAFEALVRDFEAEDHNPRTAHLVVAEYYIAVAHARVELCRRAERRDRAAPLKKLRRAHSDLVAAAKLPLYRAHALFIEGCIAWLSGSTAQAARVFSKAEALAQAETCPWVLSEIARVRAHMLRDDGKLAAAHDQARFGELLAREHGAMPRARRIRDEFGLTDPALAGAASSSSWTSARSSGHARRQLTTLLHAVQKSFSNLKADEQAAAILDDLLCDLEADRAFVSFRPEPGVEDALLVSRGRDGDASVAASKWQEDLMRRVSETGEPWPPDDDAVRDLAPEVVRGALLVFPLFLHTRVVGAVCIERTAQRGVFTTAERELLVLLSHQLPVALEITRLLAEREHLHASLLQSHKLEAVGQLAGGIAHDFNNMLAIIRTHLDLIGSGPQDGLQLKQDLEVISDTTQRATALTKQLLSFSRHQPAPRAVCSANAVISELRPMLKPLVGPGVTLDLVFADGLRPFEIDRAAFEQVLVNLAINARDAMPDGGTLRIATRNVAAEETSTSPHGRASGGARVAIEVTDTGRGMNTEVLSRMFDPFFTTKPHGSGTGLGLTRVYTFVKNCGGHVDVSSEVGRGTTFALSFPAVVVEPVVAIRAASTEPRPRRGRTILVVDDDPFIRRMMDRTLRREHHAVLLASNGADALELATQHDAEIGVVILDVLMPGMSGPELSRRLAKQCSGAKHLFMSGFAPEQLPTGASLATDFLQKPFSSEDLLSRVQRLLDG